ncbi:hypothetical protein IZU99_03060 [Oscillospiraceae bacterium CM]|nr:hypothetical protein IZU99_03060 [Oscillospiraceae bacterium CM]
MPEQGAKRTVKDLQRRVDDYFSECSAKKIYPDEAGLILFLGFDKETYERCLSGKMGKGNADCLKKAALRRESIIVRELYGTDKAATGKIFLARQAGNGGLTDKMREDTNHVTIDVRFNGGEKGLFD